MADSVLVATLRVPSEDVELASDRLWAIGARAVEERVLGGVVELRTVLGPDRAVVAERLGVLPDRWLLGFDVVDDRPTERWREFAAPMPISDRLTLVPAWIEPSVAPEAGPRDHIVVRIEPGGAFGLGDHPTTRLSAAAVDRLVRPGDRVLDVGCGSGVLAVIAAKRGASAVAIDVADEARVATEDNARRNGVGDAVSASTLPLHDVEGEFDLVVANILAPTLVALAPHLSAATATSGRLVVSGVLDGGYDHVIEALRMEVESVDAADGWAAITMRHRSAAG